MSRLTAWIRKNTNRQLVANLVAYLEDVDLPGDVKKKIVMETIKKLVTVTGGKWDKVLEATLSGAIEWILAEIRQWATSVVPDQPPETAVQAPAPAPAPTLAYPYGELFFQPIPDDQAVTTMGTGTFKPGDGVYAQGDRWYVLPPGYAHYPGSALVRVIGGSE